MASLFQRERSPYWWIKFRDPIDGQIKRESTKFRIGRGDDRRRAEQLRAEYTLRESKIHATKPSEHWDAWVTGYLKLRYADSPESLLRYEIAWRTLRMFLTEKQILLPRQFLREHCAEYMTWREQPNKSRGKYKAGHNTALLELKTMGLILAEAVLRNYAPFNPCRDMNIKRIQGKVKPELTAKAITMIREAIQKEPEPLRTFFNNSFEIAFYHGVRLSETWFNPQERVRFIAPDKATIFFVMKGNKTNAVFLHPKLVELFRDLIDSGKTETYAKPSSPAKYWFNFLTRHKIKATLPHACFHSIRVTVATTLARAGVSEKKAMEYIKHASTTIHRSYVRLKPEDLSECADAIS